MLKIESGKLLKVLIAKEQELTLGINFVGFVHSHSAGKKFLSRPDVHYANNI